MSADVCHLPVGRSAHITCVGDFALRERNVPSTNAGSTDYSLDRPGLCVAVLSMEYLAVRLIMVGYGVIANLPCILSQRYNRLRLVRVLEHYEKRHQGRCDRAGSGKQLHEDRCIDGDAPGGDLRSLD